MAIATMVHLIIHLFRLRLGRRLIVKEEEDKFLDTRRRRITRELCGRVLRGQDPGDHHFFGAQTASILSETHKERYGAHSYGLLGE